jgi:hypothetical protein
MDFKHYYAVTKDACLYLGEHPNEKDAELRGIDRYNIHQAQTYFILAEDKLLSLTMDIAEVINGMEVF